MWFLRSSNLSSATLFLSRFSYSRYSRDKITAFVDFPVEGLDMSQWLCCDSSQRPLYDLYAVSHHYGGLGGGHYTATAKNAVDGKWYDLNDSHVSETDVGKVRTSSAYVLFYKRRAEV